MGERYDAVVVGAGPNGLSAAIRLAAAGRSVLVVEGRDRVGGGSGSAALTLPGFVHDVCSAIHPLGAGSPFWSRLPLHQHGLDWIDPPAAAAHVLDDGPAVLLERSVAATAAGLGGDARSWNRVVGGVARRWPQLAEVLLAPLRAPRHPLDLARFGLPALRSARALAHAVFDGDRARALFAGLAAHAILPLERPMTASFGLLFGALGHAVGWPLPRGGAQAIADALAAHLGALGGQLWTGHHVTRLSELPPADAVVLDVTPRQALAIAADALGPTMRWRLQRFRYGPGVFKVDYALSEPVPWRPRGAERAATVHVGGTFDEVASSEAAVAAGRHPDRPFLLVAQHTPFDPSRAPAGQHTLWVYTHVPNGSTVDLTDTVEAQLERFAPGFRDVVLARATMTCADLEAYNDNYVGGDISAGAHDGLQLLLRPVASVDPYRIGRRVWLCSASTPPGAGVHGMCGFHAAGSVLRVTRRR